MALAAAVTATARPVTGWELDDAATGVYKAPAGHLATTTGSLYYKPLPGQDLRQPRVELPRLESLAQIADTYDDPARNLRFAGLAFTGTTWLHSNTPNAVEVLGPDRLMFGSDWPVCLLATSYQRWIDTVSGLLAGCDVQHRDAIWRRTAQRVRAGADMKARPARS